MHKYYIIILIILGLLPSCEEVIHIDLNTADPAFVVEAVIYKDSTCNVRLTRTSDYFSAATPAPVEGAVINISDGVSSEDLIFSENGLYIGTNITGTEGKDYQIEIQYNGVSYKANSTMPVQTNIISLRYSKNNNVTIFNPEGKTMYSINCEFTDEPDKDNYYMVRFILDGKVKNDSYYVLNEHSCVNGTLELYDLSSADSDTINFSEWMFYDGGEAEVQVISIDKPVYDYFVQLNDVLYWKRRFYPPAQYNPQSNISNGALGYFAAWSFDSRKITLE